MKRTPRCAASLQYSVAASNSVEPCAIKSSSSAQLSEVSAPALRTGALSLKPSRAFDNRQRLPEPKSHYCDIRVTKERETFMQAISRFVRTTIFGGVLFLTPIVVIWLILGKAYNIAGRALQPVTALIPDSLSSRTTITAVLEVLLIALACFLAGLLARTIGRRRSCPNSKCRFSPRCPATNI